MKTLLALAQLIDTVNERLGRAVRWLVGLVTVISAGNALLRYGFNLSSNAWLEIQWYLFAAIFLLGAGYTLKHNGHVRIDVLHGRCSATAQAWIDILGHLLFLLPLCGLIIGLSWPGVVESFRSGEMSPDAGGLLRWPVRLLIPLGFALLGLQALAEVIKRAAFFCGAAPLATETPVVEE